MDVERFERLIKALVRTIAGVGIILAGLTPAFGAYPRPISAPHGMVVSAEMDASKVGVQILKAGGNAVDAAVAVAFALAVVHPEAGNLGGGGFLMIHLASGQNLAIDFRETAPAAASRTMYLDKRGKIIPGASTIGYRAVGVPGTVAGLDLAERRFGRLSWSQVLEPARLLALHGARVSFSTADTLGDADIRNLLNRFPESRRIFYPHGKLFLEGSWMTRPELAQTLARLQHYGARDFYRGKLAREMAADMAANHGLITLRDLANYRPVIRKPVEGSYRGYRIVSMPLPSSGGIALVEMLNILQRYDLKTSGFGSARTMHLMIEAMRRAFADRSHYLGDPAFVHPPVSRLISPSYAAKRAQSILPDRATPSSQVGAGQPSAHEGANTTHFSIVDSAGNAAACTYTLNGLFGSGVTVPGTGIVLNNEMDDFTSSPGSPNMFGLIQGEANAIAPGKRPLSSMTPTFVFRNGKLAIVTGSPGGPTIINTVLQILVNVIDFEMDASAATSAPRFHHQWMPDEVRLEPGSFSPDTLARLKGMGYHFGKRHRMGDAQTIIVDRRTGTKYGGADPRWSGAAVGY